MMHDHQAGKSGIKHMLLMLLCCLVPLAAILAVAVFNIPLNTVVRTALVLFCPVAMLLMMFFMHRSDSQPAAGHEHLTGEKEETGGASSRL